MPRAEDQHPVGDLAPGGEHEPFGVSVRARASGRNFHGFDTSIGQDCVKDSVNWPARSRTRKRAESACWPMSISNLRAAWVVQAPSGWVVMPARVRAAGAVLDDI